MMNQPVRPRQASPLSIESTDSFLLSRYQSMSPGDSPYGAVASKGAHTSPPISQHPSTSTDNSLPTSSRSTGGSNGHISSASSAARSSEGNGLYSPIMSDSGRSQGSRTEEALQEHYHVLKGYLKQYLENDSGARPTRARDKLLRLSPTQFLELSTDVYDELLRREDHRQRRGEGVPRSLPPKNIFHPKRNQARQKLSTLPPERFRQLATDVYYELERRVPRLGGGSIDRTDSPGLNAASIQGSGRPSPYARGPGNPPGPNRGPPSNGHSSARTPSNEYGRPLPKTFQSNTIVPNKSTMVEDDESDEDDPMGVESVVNGLTKRATKSSGSDQEQSKMYEAQIADLQEKMAALEDRLQSKDREIEDLESSRRERELDFGSERDGWTESKSDLERRVVELQGFTEAHHAEMDRAHQNHAQREANLRDQMEQNVADLQSQLDSANQENTMLQLQGGPSERETSDGGDWEERCKILQDELAHQEKVTEEVRQNATEFLREMRALSEQSEAALEKEEELRSHIAKLESEVEEWKTRYAKTKTQLRTLRASSIGLPLQHLGNASLSSRQEYLSHNGIVHDVDVTNFQISIDELLVTARQNASEAATLERMKAVITRVQHITGSDDGSSGADMTGLLSPMSSPNLTGSQTTGGNSPPTSSVLKARVSRTANALITATRNHVSASGLSPVSLLDAAAANLTAAVIDYLKTVGIKATSAEDLARGVEAGDGFEMLAPTTHVMESSSSAKGMADANANGNANPMPAAESLNGGWFSRLKGSFDSAYSNDAGGALGHGRADGEEEDEEDEYASYR